MSPIPFIPSIDCFPFMAPNWTSFATSLSPETPAWITTLSPTFKSFRVAASPLFANLVLSFTSTVTDFLAGVSTVIELSEMLVTLPITCFSFPWASAIRESANNRVTTATMRFIMFSSVIVVRWWFGCRIAWLVFVQELLFFYFLLFLPWTLRIERLHLTLLRYLQLRHVAYDNPQ